MTAVRCLVMGGNRYIGASLVAELARRGHEVTVMNSHESSLPDGVQRLHGDRREPGVIEEVLGPCRDDFDAVFDNTAYVPADLEPMLELFAGRVRHFVFTSSVAVYRPSLVHPIAESSRRYHGEGHPEDRLVAYGSAKVRCEDALVQLHERTGEPITILRVSHTVGPRSPLGTREPVMFTRLERRRPILVPGDGFPFVHLVHIDDAARCLAAVIGNDRARGQVYNVAGREVASVLGHVALMGAAVGVEPDVVRIPLDIAKALSPPLVHWAEAYRGGAVFDITKVLAELDWAPQLDLAAAYRDSYEWFRTAGRFRYEFDFSAEDRVLADLP